MEKLWNLGTIIPEDVPMARAGEPDRVDFEAEGINIEENIEYGFASGQAQLLDVIWPKDGDGPFPCIVWVHGGGWSSEELTKRYRPEVPIAKMVKHGYVVASIDYRLAQVAPFPAQIEDCREAVRYLRANAAKYKIDVDKFAAWGESAGGHLTELMAVAGENDFIRGGNTEYSSQIQAAIPWYAPCDLKRDPDTLEGPFKDMFGRGTREEAIALMEAASPITYVAKKNPPMLLMHGNVDRLVNLQESLDFQRELTNNGNEASLIIVGSQCHGFFIGQEYYDMIEGFLNAKLKG